MARMLKLKRGTTELNLLAAEGAGWRAGAWDPAVAQVRYGGQAEPVEEKIVTMVERDSHNNLAISVQALDEMAFWADAYVRDQTVIEPVWLYAKMTDETGERRALVRKIEYKWLTPAVSATGYAKKNRAQMRITITREAYWERTASRSFPSTTLPAGAAVLYDYSALFDVQGDTDARVEALQAALTTGQSDRLWIGVRSSNKIDGDAANLEPIWECEDGTNNASESGIIDVVDVAASGGDYVRVREIDLNWDNAWHRAYSITFDHFWPVGPNHYTDNYGLFLWLLRSRVTSGTWEVYLRFGHSGMDDDEFISKDTIEVDTTAWNFYEIAMQQLPIRNLQLPFVVGTVGKLEVQVWARRTSGSGDLHLDCLTLVPVDESFLYIENMDLSVVATICVIGQTPLGDQGVYTVDSPVVTAFGWCNGQLLLPPGDGRMVVVCARESSSVLTDRLTLSGHCYERWASLRGSE